MRKLFDEKVFDILPVEGGFIIAFQKELIEDKVVVSFKSVSTENGVVEQRTKGDYMFVKYGRMSKDIGNLVGNYITTNCAVLDNGNLFIVKPDGYSQLLDTDGNVIWNGTLTYKGCGPSSMVQQGNTVWATFSEKNAIIRFNLNTMREELRIGGSNDSAFNYPTGLWINEDAGTMYVCNTGDCNLLEVDLKSYTVFENHRFNVPIYKYIKVDQNEIVILDGDLYKL